MVAIVAAVALPQLGAGAVVTSLAVSALSIVDRLYTFPALFGAEDSPRPDQFQELDLATSDVGAPRNWAFGREVIVPCHLLWMSDPVRTTVQTGKGGKGATSVQQDIVTASFAIAMNDGYMAGMHRLWVDGKQWYSDGTFFGGVSEHRMSATAQASTVLLQATQIGSIDFSQAFAVGQVVQLVGWDDGSGTPVLALNDFFVVLSTLTASSVGLSEMVLQPINNQAPASGVAGTEIQPGQVQSPSVVANYGKQWRWGVDILNRFVVGDMSQADASVFNVGDSVHLHHGAPNVGAGVGTCVGDYKVLFVTNAPLGAGLGGWKLILDPVGLTIGTPSYVAWIAQLQSLQPLLFSGNPSAFFELQNRVNFFSPVGSSPTPSTNWLFYHGGFLHTVDPDIEADVGVGNTSSYLGTCYARFSEVNLNNFGNRIPQLRALIRRHHNDRLLTPIQAILQRHGFGSGEYRIPGAWSVPLLGYNVRGPITGIQALQPLMVFYDFIVQERGPEIVIFPRKQAATVAVQQVVSATGRTVLDVGAREFGTQMTGLPVQVQTREEETIPTRVEVTFTDPTNEHQTGTEPYGQRNPAGADRVENVLRIDVASLVVQPWEAKNRAAELLYQAQLNGTQVTVDLPPSYVHLLENDRLTLTDPTTGEGYGILVQRVTRGANMILHIEGFVDSTDQVVGSTAYGQDPLNAWRGGGPAAPVAYALDIAAVRNQDLIDPILYLAAASPASWGGVNVWESLDDSNYYHIGSLGVESNIGIAEDILSYGVGVLDFDVWDETNTVTVRLYTDLTPTTIAQASVLQWRNIMLVGDEVIGFANVTDNGDGTFTLSSLRRGLRDTETFAATHAIGDRVVLLFDHLGVPFTSIGAVAHRIDPPGVDETRYYKFVPAGLGLNDVTAEAILIEGWNARPFAPTTLAKALDGSNNATFTWSRVSRAIVKPLTNTATRMIEDHEQYDLEIIDSTGAAVVRTFQLRTEFQASRDAFMSIVYTATQQTTDGFTPGQALSVRLYQVGEYGRSHPLIDTSI